MSKLTLDRWLDINTNIKQYYVHTKIKFVILSSYKHIKNGVDGAEYHELDRDALFPDHFGIELFYDIWCTGVQW